MQYPSGVRFFPHLRVTNRESKGPEHLKHYRYPILRKYRAG